MLKQELKNSIEEIIANQMELSDLSREDVLESAVFYYLEQYFNDEISKQELIEIGDYLEYPIDLEKVEKLKTKHQKQKQYRLKHKQHNN